MTIPPHVHELMQIYFEGDSSPETVEAIESWLKEDQKNLRIFAEYGCIEDMLFAEQESIDSEAVHTVIASEEVDSDIDLRHLTTYPFETAEKRANDTITARQLASLAGYLLGQSMTSRAAYKLYMVAAAVLFAATLFLIFGDGDSKTTDTVSVQPPNIDQPAETPATMRPTIVAALTAEHDAVWDRRPGQDLFAGQRMTLTQGFAEITTARGAVAIIEAPAIIELIDNDNAIRLKSGKMVGICEVPTSQGFVVRTPHLDITDLGTRFGVVTDRHATDVHVFEGAVEVSHTNVDRSTEPTRLSAGNSAFATVDRADIERLQHDAQRFAELLPPTIPLRGTGVGISLHKEDPAWRLVAIDGQQLPSSQALLVNKVEGDLESLLEDSNACQWIKVDKVNHGSPTNAIRYTIQTQFELPQGINPDSATLRIQFDADDSLVEVRLNGLAASVPENDFRDYRRELHPIKIDRYLVAGVNTVEFDLMDYTGTDTGIRVMLSIETNRSAFQIN